MFYFFLSFFLLIITALIQGHASFDFFSLGGVKPDLQFILIIFLACRYGPSGGMFSGFWGGMVQDTISNSIFGLLAFPKMFLGFLIGSYSKNIMADNMIVQALLVFSASILKGIFTILLCYFFQKSSFSFFITIIFPEAIYNTIIGLLFFPIWQKIFKDSLNEEEL